MDVLIRFPFGPGLYRDEIYRPHLYLDRSFVPRLLNSETYRHAMQKVIVDISKKNCLLIQHHLLR